MSNQATPSEASSTAPAITCTEVTKTSLAPSEAQQALVRLGQLHQRQYEAALANPYSWSNDCLACDQPTHNGPRRKLTEHHFYDEHGALRCWAQPHSWCFHCHNWLGEPVSWPCETMQIIEGLQR